MAHTPRAIETDEMTPQPCTMTLDDHIELALGALTAMGLGLACETEYRALLVIAEAAKIVHGHSQFEPQDDAHRIIQQGIDTVQARAATPEDDGHIH